MSFGDYTFALFMVRDFATWISILKSLLKEQIAPSGMIEIVIQGLRAANPNINIPVKLLREDQV